MNTKDHIRNTLIKTVPAGIIIGAVMIANLACQSERGKEYDVVVYGQTSAGVMAAVQARRMNKTVIVVGPDVHLGGMSSGGLGATDIGNKAVIGGLSREFYQRIGERYGMDEMWTFEPHVAEKVFEMEKRGATLEELAPLISGQKGLEVFKTGDLDSGLVACGQVVGLIRDIPTIKQLVDGIIHEAEDIMSRFGVETMFHPLRKPD